MTKREDGQAPLMAEDQQRALDLVLEELIPPSADGRLPGAGDVGLGAHVAAALQPVPPLRQMIVAGLAALDDLARGRWRAERFAALPRAERAAALEELASSEHAFPPVLVLHAYAAYYQHPRVLEALGLAPWPPHPAGYTTVEGDLSLVEPVQRRGRIYREC
jgi:hypothetical protein